MNTKLPAHYDAFRASLTAETPPQDWPEGLRSLWYDAKGDWEASHDIAQEMDNELGCWIHAYLHRKEGDEFNAGYWYRRAGRSFPKKSFSEELREMVDFVLETRN